MKRTQRNITPAPQETTQLPTVTPTETHTLLQQQANELAIAHKYTRPNRDAYDALLKAERQFTNRLNNITSRIAQKRQLIAKGYKLVETEEKTKVRQANKRERVEMRRSQIEHLRVEVYELERERVQVQYDLKSTRKNLMQLNRALKYFSKFDKQVNAETLRANYNTESYLNRTIAKLQPTTVFTLKSAGDEEQSRTLLLTMLLEKAPAMFEVFSRRESLLKRLFERVQPSSTLVPAAADQTNPA